METSRQQYKGDFLLEAPYKKSPRHAAGFFINYFYNYLFTASANWAPAANFTTVLAASSTFSPVRGFTP